MPLPNRIVAATIFVLGSCCCRQAAEAAFDFIPGHYYTSNASQTLTEFNASGVAVGTLVIPTSLGFEARGLAFGPDFLLYTPVLRPSGFAVLAYDSSGTLRQTYTSTEAYIGGNSSFGKIAVSGEYIFVAGGDAVTRFTIGVPNSGTIIYTGNQIFDVELLPNGNLLAASAYGIAEITPAGALVRNISLQGGERFVDIRGIAYDPATEELFVTQLGYTNFSFQLMRVDATTGFLEANVTVNYADDLFLTPSGQLLVGSYTQRPTHYSQALVSTGFSLGTSPQVFVTQFNPVPEPTVTALLAIGCGILALRTRLRRGAGFSVR